jgi:PhzF family phenazine biosynthesis protein
MPHPAINAIPYWQLDVFAERAGDGNPLAVVFDADDWPTADMQSFAAWADVVETTFVLAPTTPQASYRLRIFTPHREIAFAGHPTIGSAHAVLEAQRVQPLDGRLIQECGAGLLPILVEGEGAQRCLFVQAPRARILKEDTIGKRLLSGILHNLALGALPPAFVEGGRRWWLAELASETQLRAWQPDHAAIGELAKGSDSLGLCVFSRSSSADYDLVVRAFPAGVGIVEDPASGAANGLIAAYIATREPDGRLARRYRVSQGREIGRNARILVRIDADSAVWIGGRTQTVIRGLAHWPVRET